MIIAQIAALRKQFHPFHAIISPRALADVPGRRPSNNSPHGMTIMSRYLLKLRRALFLGIDRRGAGG